MDEAEIPEQIAGLGYQAGVGTGCSERAAEPKAKLLGAAMMRWRYGSASPSPSKNGRRPTRSARWKYQSSIILFLKRNRKSKR